MRNRNHRSTCIIYSSTVHSEKKNLLLAAAGSDLQRSVPASKTKLRRQQKQVSPISPLGTNMAHCNTQARPSKARPSGKIKILSAIELVLLGKLIRSCSEQATHIYFNQCTRHLNLNSFHSRSRIAYEIYVTSIPGTHNQGS